MNARLPKLFLALCLGAGTLALGGCQKEEIPPKTEFVLFDLSASTASREVRARYLEDFEKLLANMRGETSWSSIASPATRWRNRSFRSMRPSRR